MSTANLTNLGLWESISGHQFPAGKLSFLQRLARENQWSMEFATAAINEYRRFIYLCCLRKGMTPSVEVDQVWHLHLLYSEDYHDFCQNVLGKNILHGPTKGGEAEVSRFRQQYLNTLLCYENEFGKPDSQFWPNVADRFSGYRMIWQNQIEANKKLRYFQLTSVSSFVLYLLLALELIPPIVNAVLFLIFLFSALLGYPYSQRLVKNKS